MAAETEDETQAQEIFLLDYQARGAWGREGWMIAAIAKEYCDSLAASATRP